MTFLRIYDYLNRHRVLTFVLLVAAFAVCVLLGLRLRFKENVADFLPVDDANVRYTDIYNALGDQNKTTIIFSGESSSPESQDEIIEALDDFEQLAAQKMPDARLQCRIDDTQVWDAMDFVGSHTPLFLTRADYARADSLLAQPDYLSQSLDNVMQMLSQPTGSLVADAVVADPLNLFSPALQRLRHLSGLGGYQVVDEYLFDEEGCHAFAFLDTAISSTDTRAYTQLSRQLSEVFDSVMGLHPSVKVTAVGAGLIAAANATQIKHDSLIAILLAVVFIAVILTFGIARRQNILWLGVSVLFGWLFALAAIALFRPEISVIVIGIGSVLVGIAVNYPLHFIDHLRDHPDRREALSDMVEPLVVGNITTVSAFACLVFVRAEAMRDLGLFGALMLVGTILFVMVFLPHLAKGGAKASTSHLRLPQMPRLPRWVSVSCFAVVVLLSVWFAFLSSRTEFDSNLSNINYMTTQQRTDLSLLSRSIDDDSAHTLLYVVAAGSSIDEALGVNAQFSSSPYPLSGLGELVPSPDQQRERLLLWEDFCQNHPRLLDDMRRMAAEKGFSDDAFDSFYQRFTTRYTPLSFAEMSPLLDLADDYILANDSAVYVVNFLRLPNDEALLAKDQLRQVPRSVVFDQSDVGNNLVSALSDDFNYILYVCGFVVFFFLCLSFRSLELSLLAFLPLTVGWFWILGIMSLADIRFNIVNIILATFIFGQGDDYTIFITEGLISEYAWGRKRLRGFRRSVILSALLMFVGIGTLIFAKHPAMRSLAEVAIIGMAVVVVMACYLPPVIFRWMTFHHGRKRVVPVTLMRLLRTFVSLLVFVLVALVIFTPFTWIYRLIGRDSDRKRLRYHQLICFLNRAALWALPGVKYQLDNGVGETFSEPAVIVANHQSHLDLLCMLSLNPKLVVLTNDWVWHNPVYGVIIRYAEYYPASNGYEANLAKLRSLVSRGYSVVVFPEGTRSLDGSVGRFHKGAFSLAHDLGLPILPVWLHGTGHVMPKDDILLRKGSLYVEVGRRFLPTDNAQADAVATRALVQRHYDEICRRREDESYWTYYVDAQYFFKGRSASRRKPGRAEMLRALANPDRYVPFTVNNEDDYLLINHFALRPANLIVLYAPAEREKLLVMGGGMGGLMTGAMLAQKGFEVTVLEKNKVIGGGFQCFRRSGALFATGLHVFGGFESDGILRQLFDELGIVDQLRLCPTDTDCQDEVLVQSDGTCYRLPCGREAYIDALASYFPEEREGILRYVDTLYDLVDNELIRLSDRSSQVKVHPLAHCPVGEFINSFVSDPRLRQLLSYINPLYAGTAEHTPAFLHALVVVQHIKGSFQLFEGSQHLADLLVQVITERGGRVLTGQKVSRVVVNDRKVQEVQTESGECFSADCYISAIHPNLLFDRIEGKAFTPSFVHRITASPNTCSGFTVYIKFKPNRFHYINHAVYCVSDYADFWHQGDVRDQNWPRGAMFVTPPGDSQDEWADTMIIHCSMAFSEVARWADTVVAHRGADYEEWKRQHIQQVVDFVSRSYPSLSDAIDTVFAASPLTIRDYFGNPEGTLYGIRKECDNLTQTQMSVRTKVSNLYMTGQNVNLHGFFGVAVSAIETVKAILQPPPE